MDSNPVACGKLKSDVFLRYWFSSWPLFIGADFMDLVTNGMVFPQEYFFLCGANTAQKMKFSIKNFFSKCDQILGNLRIWSHLLKKFLKKNFIFCGVKVV